MAMRGIEGEKKEKPVLVPHDTLQAHEKYGENRPRLVQVGSNYEVGGNVPVNRFMDYRIAIHDITPEKRPATAEGTRDLTIKLFAELEARGIPVAAQNVIAMQDTIGRDAVFVSAKDVVRAESMDAKDGKISTENANALAALWHVLFQYYKDKAASGEPFLYDTYRFGQYEWGKVDGDKENKLYLVDVDPHIADSKEMLGRAVSRLALEIEKISTDTMPNMPELKLSELVANIRKADTELQKNT